MGTLFQDLRYGFRMLAKSPGFTMVAVLSLALGIGANTAIFSLIDAVLLKLLPVPNPQQLVLLDWTSQGTPWDSGVMNSISGNMDWDDSGRTTSPSFPYPVYDEISAHNHVFSGVLALAANETEVNLSYNGEPGRADGELVSGSFFSTLEVQPILGRTFTLDDDRIGAEPVAVISYGYWEQRFGRDPRAVGQKVTVNAVPFTIVGVSPPEFYGVQPGRAIEIYLPLHTQPRVEPRWSPSGTDQSDQSKPPLPTLFEERTHWWLLIMGRLKPGVTEQQARAGLDVLLQQTIAPEVKPTAKPQTVPHLGLESGSQGLEYLRRQFSKPLFILMTVVGLVLLIACANVANLLLARASTRQKEIAVRLAVGAKRSRLVRQLLTESVLLAGMGGVLGLVLAFWGTDLLVALMSSGREPVTLNVSPDPRVLGFTVAVSVATGILFGFSPALRSTHVELAPALKESAAMLPGVGRRGLRLGLGKTLVVAQVALSLLLLVGAGLFVRTLMNLEHVNAGFNQQNLLLFGIDPTQDGYQGQRLADFYLEFTRRLEVLPGVRSVSMSNHTLVGGGMSEQDFHIPGYAPKPGQKPDEAEAFVNWVGPKFFETMGIPLLLGRTIGERDTAGAPKVVVVNKEFAREFLRGDNPVGLRFGFGDPKEPTDIEIIGMVADSKFSDLHRDVPPTIYVPCFQSKRLGGIHFEVRTAGEPRQMAASVRRAAQGMDPNLALYDVKSQMEQIDQSLFQERLFARLTGFFGLLAALLACIGVYGIMAFAASRRTREIGIRMALGAGRGEIMEMVLRETLLLVAIGVAAGIGVALEASRLVSTFLFGLKPNDPMTIVIAAVLMVAAAALAGHVPARRASRVQPMVALRYE
jgi:predicted permease